MKTGKVSQAVLDRSVLRPLSRAGVLGEQGPAFGKDAGNPAKALITEKKESREQERKRELRTASVCGTLGGDCDRDEQMLLASVVNNLAASGADAESVMITLLFPAEREEQELKEIMERIGSWCRSNGLRVAGGHTEVSTAVWRPMLSVTGFGSLRETSAGAKGLQPGQDLVMTGWAGMAGTAILAEQREQELLQRYPFSILDGAKDLKQGMLITSAACWGEAFGVSSMHDVSQGGIFGALWEMAEYGGVGLEIDLKRIPIRQETIEICEFFDLNPYQLYGQGALLLGTNRGETLAEWLRAEGISAAVIGRTTNGKERILRNGEDVRYLDRPAQDSLWVLNER